MSALMDDLRAAAGSTAKRASPRRFPGAFVRVRCCECPRLIHVRRDSDVDNARCERCRAERKKVQAELRRARLDREADAKCERLAPEECGPPPRLGIPAALAIIENWMR